MKLVLRSLWLLATVFSPSATAAATPTYSTVAAQVFKARCNTCHDGQTRVRFTDYDLTVTWIDDIERVVFEQRSMPTDGPLTSAQSAMLRAWIDAGAPDDSGHAAPRPTPYPGSFAPNYASIRWYVFDQKCMSCHGRPPLSDKVPLGNYSALLDPKAGLITPGHSDRSPLFIAIDRDYADPKLMPPPGSGIPPLTPEEVVTIMGWIDDGAPENSASH